MVYSTVCHGDSCIGYSKLVITEGHKVPEKKTYKDESNNESVNEGSKQLDACTLSSEDSGDEADSETSYGEEESGDDGDLEFLVSGKTVVEVRTYLYTIKTMESFDDL